MLGAAGGALHDAYARTFDAIRLRVEFTIDELVVASDDVAYALTRSRFVSQAVSRVLRRSREIDDPAALSNMISTMRRTTDTTGPAQMR